MDRQDKKGLWEKFIEDPRSLYDSAPELTPEERQELTVLEETMCGLFFMQMNELALEGPLAVELEEETAAYLDGRGKKPAGFSAAIGQQIMNARTIMENRSIPSYTLPEVLRNIMEKTLAEEKRTEVPGAVIRLKENGMEVIKSVFQNVFQEDALFEATRGVTAPAMQTPRIGLTHRGIMRTEYQIIRENKNSVMLNLNLPADIPGRVRIDLIQNDSVIDSRTLAENERALNFAHLGAGSYDIVIKAKDTYRFGFVIDRE